MRSSESWYIIKIDHKIHGINSRWKTNITMEHHHFVLENSPFCGPFSLAGWQDTSPLWLVPGVKQRIIQEAQLALKSFKATAKKKPPRSLNK